MSRGDLPALAAAAPAVVAAALSLGGCMRIYPDPELPDISVEWLDSQCPDDGGRVVMSLATVDPEAEVAAATVPCTDAGATFPDVARVRYHLEARLEDAAGAMLATSAEELDLSDGRNERVFAFFGRFPMPNFHVGWTFDMGETCQSLGADLVTLQISDGQGALLGFDAPCAAGSFVDEIPIPGAFSITALAITDVSVVAASPASPLRPVGQGMFTDFGTLVLSPCGSACPLP